MADETIPDFSLIMPLNNELSPEQLVVSSYLTPVLKQCFQLLGEELHLSLDDGEATAPLVGILASLVAKVAVTVSLEVGSSE